MRENKWKTSMLWCKGFIHMRNECMNPMKEVETKKEKEKEKEKKTKRY